VNLFLVRSTVIKIVITYVVIIIMGLRYVVFLMIHVICVKMDITKIKQYACVVLTLAANHVPTPHAVKHARLDTGESNATQHAVADVSTTRVT